MVMAAITMSRPPKGGGGATAALLVLVEVERRAPKDTLSNILNTQEYVRFSLTVSLHIDGVVCT
jgi:hypothetical protein